MNGTDGATLPFWSPDNRFVAFFADQRLKKIDASGGPPQNLCEARLGRGGTWNRDGVILFAPTDLDPIHRVSANGGAPVPVTRLVADKEYSHRFPSFLPDGKHYLFLAQSHAAPQDRGRIYVGKLGSGEIKELLVANSPARYAAPGHILYARDRALLAQPFDLGNLQLAGDAFPLVDRVQYTASSGSAAFSAADDGTISYQLEGAGAISQLSWSDREGKPLGVVGTSGEILSFRLSRKGDRVAFERLDQNAGTSDIWIHDLVRNISTRFTFEPTHDNNPVWGPNDSRVIYSSQQINRASRNIVQKISSGAGQEETLFVTHGASLLATSDVSADGRYLLFQHYKPGSTTSQDVWIYSFADRKAAPFVQSKFVDFTPTFSPDGRWIAYSSDESGRREVYIQPFPATGAKWQISVDGGLLPKWRADGKEIFYVTGDNGKMMSAAVEASGGTFSAAIPQALFVARNGRGAYDVSADGQRFLMLHRLEEETSPAITVVLNWTAELRKP